MFAVKWLNGMRGIGGRKSCASWPPYENHVFIRPRMESKRAVRSPRFSRRCHRNDRNARGQAVFHVIKYIPSLEVFSHSKDFGADRSRFPQQVPEQVPGGGFAASWGQVPERVPEEVAEEVPGIRARFGESSGNVCRCAVSLGRRWCQCADVICVVRLTCLCGVTLACCHSGVA